MPQLFPLSLGSHAPTRHYPLHTYRARGGYPTRDLGYYVGYKICQAYYNKTADKKQAVAGMLIVGDFNAFLDRSGYEKQLEAI